MAALDGEARRRKPFGVLQGLRPNKTSTKKGPEDVRKLTGGLWRSDLRRRTAGVEDGRRRTAVLGVRLKGRASGLLGSTGSFVESLR